METVKKAKIATHSITKLTHNESYMVSDILGRVIDAMSWDSSTGYYEDGGNFIFRCSKKDLLILKRAYKKL